MKKYSLLIMILMTFSLNLSAYGHNDHSSQSRRDKLGDFESVAIHIPAQTELIRGNSTSVDIQMSEKNARNIEVYTDRGTLVIRSRNGSWLRNADQIKIKITMPYWEALKLTSSGYIYSQDNWKLDHALIRTSGSGDIELGSVEAKKIECSSSGSGDIKIADLYTAYETELSTTGSGDLLFGRIDSEFLSLKLTGSGDFRGEMNTEIFNAATTGSGNILASGSCDKTNLQTTGSGGISGRDLIADEAYIRITGSGNITLKDGAHLKEIRMTGSGTFRSN